MSNPSSPILTRKEETFQAEDVKKGCLEQLGCTVAQLKEKDWPLAGRIAVVASIVTSVVVALVGALVMANVVTLGLSSVGAMSSAAGLYTMLAGLGLATIVTTLYVVYNIMSKRAQSKTEVEYVEHITEVDQQELGTRESDGNETGGDDA